MLICLFPPSLLSVLPCWVLVELHFLLVMCRLDWAQNWHRQPLVSFRCTSRSFHLPNRSCVFSLWVFFSHQCACTVNRSLHSTFREKKSVWELNIKATVHSFCRPQLEQEELHQHSEHVHLTYAYTWHPGKLTPRPLFQWLSGANETGTNSYPLESFSLSFLPIIFPLSA